jgi:hypothetical protein
VSALWWCSGFVGGVCFGVWLAKRAHGRHREHLKRIFWLEGYAQGRASTGEGRLDA